MKFLVIGSGGREHAISWKLAESEKVDKIYCAPGNGGTFLENKCENINITDYYELADFAARMGVDYTFVGPELPLVEGIVDIFRDKGLRIIGADKKAAMLEGSKSYAKNFMKKYGIRTAEYEIFEDMEEAAKYLKSKKHPVVIKSDGLEGGKGVLVSNSPDESLDKIYKCDKVVIEEYLEGFEVSILSITDCKTILPFLSAKDHKQAYDGNIGPNTGGMGVVSPNPFFSENHFHDFEKNILIPTLEGLKNENMDFCGIIFFGLMVTEKGCHLLEYNMRMGDPETQAVLPLLKTDFSDLLRSAHEGKLNEIEPEWKDSSNCVVVLASKGYPGKYETGFEITLPDPKKGKIFVSGACIKENRMFSSGGRVLSVSSCGNNLDEAVGEAYSIIDKIQFENSFFRKDIGR